MAGPKRVTVEILRNARGGLCVAIGHTLICGLDCGPYSVMQDWRVEEREIRRAMREAVAEHDAAVERDGQKA